MMWTQIFSVIRENQSSDPFLWFPEEDEGAPSGGGASRGLSQASVLRQCSDLKETRTDAGLKQKI